MKEIYYILNLMSITLMGGIACVLTYFISSAKHGLYSILKLWLIVSIQKSIAHVRGVRNMSIAERLIIVGNHEKLRHNWKWYTDRPIYIHSILWRFFLICTTLTMLTIFSQESIFYKPLFVFIISPCLWMSTFLFVGYSIKIVMSFYNRDVLEKLMD